MKKRMMGLLLCLMMLVSLFSGLSASAYAAPANDMVTIPVQKTWEHGDVPAEMQPAALTVFLLQNGTRIVSRTLNANNEWHGEFVVPRADGKGKAYVYTVEEEPVTGYTPAYTQPTMEQVSVSGLTGVKVTPASQSTYPVGENLVVANKGGSYYVWSAIGLSASQQALLCKAINDANMQGMSKDLTLTNTVFGSGLPCSFDGGAVELRASDTGTEIVFSTTSTWSLFYNGSLSVTAESGAAIKNTAKVEDVSHPASFTVKKTDGEGNPLKGAVFTLYDGENQAVAEKSTGDDGLAAFGPFSDAGSYTLKETRAPEYYKASEAEWTVTVSPEEGGPHIGLNPDKGVFERVSSWLVDIAPAAGFADGVLTVVNEKNTGSLTVSKRVEYLLDGERLNGSMNTGFESEEYGFVLTLDGEEQGFTLKDGESRTFEDIPYGTAYSLRERIPENAAWSHQPPGNAFGLIESPETEVQMENAYLYQRGEIWFCSDKVDAENNEIYLPGAKFSLYADSACTELLDDSLISSEEGYLDFPLYEAGTYYLKETQAPAGYRPYGKLITITVSAEWTLAAEEEFTPMAMSVAEVPAGNYAVIREKLSLTADLPRHNGDGEDIYLIEDDPIKPVEISVKKVWTADKDLTRPDSVKVALYRDGKEYDTQILSAANDWAYTWKGEAFTDEYTWTVDEPDVPKGYGKDVKQDGTSFTITNSGRPKTGDDAMSFLWAALALCSAAGAAFAAGKLRRKPE